MATKEGKETKGKQETTVEEAAPQSLNAPQSVNVQLLPTERSDQPILANVTIVQPTAGVVLLDFGFLDPGAMALLTSMARAGKKVPERVNGRLAARVAMSYEALTALHGQIGGVVQAIARQSRT